MSLRKTAAVSLGLLFVSCLCLAAGPGLISYQGRLADAGGAAIDGSSVEVTFSIYGEQSGGTALWSETQNIEVAKGLYNVDLGAATPIPDDLFTAADRWLGVKVRTDPEMSPRARITSVAYSLNAERIGGKVIQSGQATLNVSSSSSGTASVTFAKPFAAPPKVVAGALDQAVGGVSFVASEVNNITASGCDVVFSSLDGSAATGAANFDWIAIGE